MVLPPVVVILERCSTAQGPVRPASCACNTDTSAESAWGRGCQGSSKAAHVRSDRVERPAHISKPTRRDRGQRKSRTQSRWKESFTGAGASLERAGADMDKGHRFPVRTNCAAGGGHGFPPCAIAPRRLPPGNCHVAGRWPHGESAAGSPSSVAPVVVGHWPCSNTERGIGCVVDPGARYWASVSRSATATHVYGTRPLNRHMYV
jgi:hypothetical protein